jgi:hypothetical protein
VGVVFFTIGFGSSVSSFKILNMLGKLTQEALLT